MSVDNNETEMKIGHPPATKVGGRRIVNRKDRKNSDSNDNGNSESSDDVAVREIVDVDLPAKMERSYPTEAVKRVHEKPVPAVQPNHVFRADKSGSGQHQFQPRKQTH
ncbi:hypothetical protein GCK72_000066 [Caenorhabditis remanei]|uniref:Uncharacterized protein n=3 Tax=Caenorhabditis TaxID=6237 RepID=E3N7N8_CAERE|nr:hypothetical protein GCK72_000066 [Caenorhabditis remanei]EFO89076.1 hypothetical protein CRE_14257 [Caenorhabditis remanei]KAF1768254.1 hypothetical protein GCK72_000066 [Caenorhabditis remanei]